MDFTDLWSQPWLSVPGCGCGAASAAETPRGRAQGREDCGQLPLLPTPACARAPGKITSLRRQVEAPRAAGQTLRGSRSPCVCVCGCTYGGHGRLITSGPALVPTSINKCVPGQLRALRVTAARGQPSPSGPEGQLAILQQTSVSPRRKGNGLSLHFPVQGRLAEGPPSG